jgi:hypothetical protein
MGVEIKIGRIELGQMSGFAAGNGGQFIWFGGHAGTVFNNVAPM